MFVFYILASTLSVCVISGLCNPSPCGMVSGGVPILVRGTIVYSPSLIQSQGIYLLQLILPHVLVYHIYNFYFTFVETTIEQWYHLRQGMPRIQIFTNLKLLPKTVCRSTYQGNTCYFVLLYYVPLLESMLSCPYHILTKTGLIYPLYTLIIPY